MQTEGQIASPTRTGREEQLQFLRFWAFFNVFVPWRAMAVFQISDFSLFHCGGQFFLHAQRSGDGACFL